MSQARRIASRMQGARARWSEIVSFGMVDGSSDASTRPSPVTLDRPANRFSGPSFCAQLVCSLSGYDIRAHCRAFSAFPHNKQFPRRQGVHSGLPACSSLIPASTCQHTTSSGPSTTIDCVMPSPMHHQCPTSVRPPPRPNIVPCAPFNAIATPVHCDASPLRVSAPSEQKINQVVGGHITSISGEGAEKRTAWPTVSSDHAVSLCACACDSEWYIQLIMQRRRYLHACLEVGVSIATTHISGMRTLASEAYACHPLIRCKRLRQIIADPHCLCPCVTVLSCLAEYLLSCIITCS